MLLLLSMNVYAKDMESLTGKSLILASDDGTILYEKNADEKLAPASVTKIMTALLVMEAIHNGKIKTEDIVTVSENAANKTGSHIFLAPGEKMSVNDLMKGLMVASGNDAAIALAEYVSGSEQAFVEEMNRKAKSLGMINTNYENCNGLDLPDHYSSARDIMIVTKELLKHPDIFNYSTIWMDTLRDGAFGLANTNKLIRFYEGANGMKTGSTSVAGYCLSATAKRNDIQLIAVVLNAPTSKDRFSDASTLLNYGFNTYEKVNACKENAVHSYMTVKKGITDNVKVVFEKNFNIMVKKGDGKNISYKTSNLPDELMAPVNKGEKVGIAEIYNGDKKIGSVNLIASEYVGKITLWQTFSQMYNKFSDYIV